MPTVIMDSTSDIHISTSTMPEPQLNMSIAGDSVEIVGIDKETDPTVPDWAKTPEKPEYTADEVGALPNDTFIPSKLSDLEEDENHQTVTGEDKDKWNDAVYTETDPTVPDWAKASEKPSYTSEEVGAMPEDTFIPSKLADLEEDDTHQTVSSEDKSRWNASVGFSGDYNDLLNKPTNLSDFNNDEGYITGYTETDPTVPAWAKESTKPSYTAEEVGAMPDDTFIPSNMSDLENDVEAVTTEDIDAMWEGEYTNE